MNNPGAKRPSLVSASTQSAAHAKTRILSDAEQTTHGAPKPRASSAASTRPRGVIWLVFAGLILVLLVLGIWLLPEPAPNDSIRDAVIPAVGPARPAAGSATHGGAIIVDDTEARPAATPLSRIATSASTPAANPAPIAEDSPESAVPVAPQPVVAERHMARRPAAPTRSRRTDDTLIWTLMKIIGDSEKEQTGASQESMDALIGDILASNQRADQDTQNALDTIGGDGAPVSRGDAARARQAQQALAACPAVNTVEGLRCRDRVCARFEGQHPFCPRG